MAHPGHSAAVVRWATLLILLQVLSRAATFVANQVLLRFLTAELLGVSGQLEAYYLSVLVFARESLRVAIQRQGSVLAPAPPASATAHQDAGHTPSLALETQAVVNLGYVAVPLGLVVAALLGGTYLGSVPLPVLAAAPYLVPSVYMYALASVLELLSEPAFVVMQTRLQLAARASAEGLATFAKCAVTLASALWAASSGTELGVLPFALGQTAYGLALLVVYLGYGAALARKDRFSLWPQRLGDGDGGGRGRYLLSYFYQPTIKLASSMMLQGFVKQILTQGDTLLVAILSTTAAQGVYTLANNYGGLVARLIFQPVEESSRSYFSRLLAPSAGEAEPVYHHQDQRQPARVEETGREPEGDAAAAAAAAPVLPSQPSAAALTQAAEHVTSLLRLYILLSVPLVAIGPTAAPLVLALIAGPQWLSMGAGAALAAYVYYIPFLAINGLTEAFVASVASGDQVHQQSAWMTLFSVLFAVSGWVFLAVLDWGAVGLVCANAINMSARIVWTVCFIKRYFAQRGARWEVTSLMPSPLTVVAAAVASQAVRRVDGLHITGTGARPKAVMGELIKIAAVALPFVAVLAFAERRFLIHAYKTARGGGSKPPALQ